jgi:site-specific DNA-methyltransferase (adenine-specific)
MTKSALDEVGWTREGDCLVAELPENPRLVYADPPYGRGKVRQGKRFSYDDRRGGSAYNEWLVERLVRVFGVVERGWACLHHCPELSPRVLVALEDTFGVPYGQVVWQDAWVSGFRSKASFWPRVHDVLWFWRIGDAPFAVTGGPPPEGYKRRGGGEGDFRADPSVWVGPWSPGHLSFSKEKVGYPDQKPLALLGRIIAATTQEGDKVLDPFCGSGTTLVSAARLGRIPYGLDVSVDAVAATRARLVERVA